MTINNRLKELRSAVGLNQSEMAEKLGVSVSSYQKYEREKNSIMPSIEVLIKIAEFFKVSVDYLLGRENQSESDNITSKDSIREHLNAILNILDGD